MSRLKTATAVSAGGVVYRIIDEHIEVVLCGRLSRNLWGLPKGTLMRGESLLQAAVREVREETGLDARILEPLDMVEYWFVARGTRFHKTVYYYLMEPTGGDFSLHDFEYDIARWFRINEAYRLMSYRNEADTVKRAEMMIPQRQQILSSESRARQGVEENDPGASGNSSLLSDGNPRSEGKPSQPTQTRIELE